MRVEAVDGSLRPSLATFPWPIFFALVVGPIVMLGSASFDSAEFSGEGKPKLRFIAVMGGVVLASMLATGLPVLYGLWRHETFDELWQLFLRGWMVLLIVQCCAKIGPHLFLKKPAKRLTREDP